MPMKFLQANPDIGLNRLHQMTEVDVSVGVGKCAGDKILRLFTR